MSHRCSRLSLQHALIIFHIWSFSNRAFGGRGGRSPVTTRKMMIPSRALPYGRISVRVLWQSADVSGNHTRYGKDAPRRQSSRTSKYRSLSRGYRLLFKRSNCHGLSSSGATYRTTPCRSDFVVQSGSTTVGSVMTPVIPKSPRHAVPLSVIRMFP